MGVEECEEGDGDEVAKEEVHRCFVNDNVVLIIAHARALYVVSDVTVAREDFAGTAFEEAG